VRKNASRKSRLGYRVLSFGLGRGEHFTLIGDFEEIHAEMARERGALVAGLWYWGQIIRFLPSFIFNFIFWSGAMFKNYLITSLRNIKKHKGYTFINVFGLAIGLAACILVLLYTRDELSYDRYNKNADRIHRVAARMNRDGKVMDIIGAGAPMAKALIDGFPEVEDVVRFREEDSISVKVGEKSFREKRVIFSEPSFFNVFTVPLLEGDPKTSLSSPQTMVLSRMTAEKYFGLDEPVGKILRVDDKQDWKVTGVFEDIPRASHFHFDIICSFSTLETSKDPMMTMWMSFNFQTYILFRKGASPRDFEAKLPSLINTHMGSEIKQAMGFTLEEFLTKSNTKMDYYLQPLTDIHLRSNVGIGEFEPNSDIKYITLFSAVSLFILILAVVNFVNLATARSSGRAKEVGLRKVLGSFRRDLVKQFLMESVILSLISLILAVFLVLTFLPLFNRLSGKGMVISAVTDPLTAAAVVVLTLLVGLLAGAYPAFFLSAFRPSPILRGQLKSGLKGAPLRRILVVLQFAVSAMMILGTIVVFNQLHYIQTKKLGFNKDQVLILRNTNLLRDNAEIVKDEMLRYPQVSKASLSSFLPVPSSTIRTPVAREDEPDPRKALPISVFIIDHDYIDTLEMKIAAGRNFSREFPSDSDTVLINQAAVKYFGFDSPLGQRLTIMDIGEGPAAMKNIPCTVIGVVEDFHYESLRDKIGPLVIRLGKSRGNLILRIKSDAIAGTIDTLKKKWQTLLPAEPFEYSFLDESFNAMYKAELRIGQIFGVFAGLAVFIACLGLFGLAAFSAERRTKEISIHKVFGATIPDIVRMLVREYILLVGAANLIAWPVAYWFMFRWLNNFAYRTGIGWPVFAGTGALTLLIALITVGYQSVKAASANPAAVLKYE
jgi:putative ABC transport system permease protein